MCTHGSHSVHARTTCIRLPVHSSDWHALCDCGTGIHCSCVPLLWRSGRCSAARGVPTASRTLGRQSSNLRRCSMRSTSAPECHCAALVVGRMLLLAGVVLLEQVGVLMRVLLGVMVAPLPPTAIARRCPPPPPPLLRVVPAWPMMAARRRLDHPPPMTRRSPPPPRACEPHSARPGRSSARATSAPARSACPMYGCRAHTVTTDASVCTLLSAPLCAHCVWTGVGAACPARECGVRRPWR